MAWLEFHFIEFINEKMIGNRGKFKLIILYRGINFEKSVILRSYVLLASKAKIKVLKELKKISGSDLCNPSRHNF